MSLIAKLKKDELKVVAEELGLKVPKGAIVVDLKQLIESSDVFKSDIELVKSVVEYVLKEEKTKAEERSESERQLEIEKIKLAQLEREVEIANIRKELAQNGSKTTPNLESESQNNSLESLIKSVKTLTIPLPTRAESFNLFFQSLEKAFKNKNVPEESKPEILLNILGEKANNLMIYITEDDLCSYDKLKGLVLKEFQPTPQECLNHFRRAQKLTTESYVQFASRLSATFDYYCQLRKVNDFKSLCELIVSDKIFESLDRELSTHVGVKQGESYYKPQELGRECDIYLSSKGRTKIESNVFSRYVSGNDTKRFDGNNSQKFRNGRFQKNVSNVFVSQVKNDKCVLCKTEENHALYSCPEFKKLSVNERIEIIKINKACFKCLSPNCSVKRCKSRNCFCGKPHNKLIHFPREAKNVSSMNETQSRPDATGNEINSPPSGGRNAEHRFSVTAQEFRPSFVATNVVENKKNVILSTVQCLMKDRYQQWQKVRCLLDVGSQICLMSSECLQRLQLKSEKINQAISCINDASLVVNRRVTATLANKNKSFERDISMLIVQKITDLIPNQLIDVRLQIPESVKLADPDFNVPGKIDILIGAEYFYDIIKSEKIKAENSSLTLQDSVFGFIVGGSISSSDKLNSNYCGLACGVEELNSNMRKFWEIEEITSDLPKSKENSICEEHYDRTHRRDKTGKYIVCMPFREHWSCLGNSRDIALTRLESLWTRLSRDQEYLNLYRDFLKEYEQLGHMTEVKESVEPEVTYYMPHHGVYRPQKSTTKLRTVFNASTLTTSGKSLNSIQYNGGVIQDDLFSLLVRFRKHIFAFTADIRQMYRRINIDESQRHLQRILWKENTNEPVKVYQLNTVTYGTVSAPYLAMRTLKQIAIDEGKNFPIAASVLCHDFYMDDVLSGASTLEAAKALQFQLIGILKTAQMSLHKWCGNNSELIPTTEKEYEISSTDEIKTLGIAWKARADCFTFKVEVEQDAHPTKRSVLSVIARLFDPLGLLGPVITRAKIFMQQLWLLKIDWNERLPVKEAGEWQEFVRSLTSLSDINIERCIVIRSAEVIELHGFCDASEKAYGATIYARSVTPDGEVKVKLVASKSRVAPIKQVTIPRLELCSAVLLTTLMHKVQNALKMDITSVFYWTDSTIVLSWMKNEPRDLKTFVANRVAIIQESTEINQWHHVPSEQNPADIISRGLDPDKLLHQKLWWNGPEFLVNNDYPDRAIYVSERLEEFDSELKSSSHKDSLPVLSVTVNNFVHELINLSNKYVTVLRILSYIFRFAKNSRNPSERVSGPLQVQEINEAEKYLIKTVQQEQFGTEIQNLKQKGSVQPTSKLKDLNPFLDSDGVLRVGGRLGNANLTFDRKHPAVIPKGHALTLLIIVHYHKKYLHIGACALLSCVREKFWPLSGRSSCRKIVHECVICFKAKPTISTQLMGNLPKDRVVPDFPFNCSGVDFCGPFFLKYRNQRKGILHKVYVCIFVCFVSKAVHIELVSDLTSESFIATLKRFIARRGKCAKLYSDNAKNFLGASKEIKRLHALVKNPDQQLAGFLSAESIDWKFIPPRAPNFGGLWEAAIKAFKYHFKRVVGGANLTYEEFLTVITQIEGILNSRPLSPLTTNEDDFGVLTPSHFLIGRCMNTIIEPDLTNINGNKLKKWQRITKIVQLIWKGWHRNYLNQLQQRSKWKFEKNNVNKGDLVLLVEDNLPTHKWLLGRIIDVFYGEDKKVRVVQVKTQTGVFKRSISKICVLPMPN